MGRCSKNSIRLPGAMTGAIVGAAVMFWMWKYTAINGYLYTAGGIVTCVVVGFVASLFSNKPTQDLTGLTIYTLHSPLAGGDVSVEEGLDG